MYDRSGAAGGWISTGTWTVEAPLNTISGIVTAGGSPLAGVTLRLSGSQNASMTTGSSGSYSFSVSQGGNYTVTPSMPGVTFSPSQAQLSDLVSNQTQNFSESSVCTGITTFSGLLSCISSGQATCQLGAGTIPVTSTIPINRYGVTLAGCNTTSDHTQTRLVRSSSFSGPLIQVAVPGVNEQTVTLAQARTSAQNPNLPGIVIRDLTVCGAGNSYPNITGGLLPAVMSPSGNVSTTYPCADHSAYPPATGCTYSNQCTDLNVTNIDSGYYPSNPFSNTGPYALELNDVDMEDSAGNAISLYAAGPYSPSNFPSQKVNDVWIHNGAINYSAITGILYGFNFQTYDNRFCDTFAQHGGNAYADDPSLIAPRNIRIEYNDFNYNNTGAMGGGPIRWVGLRNNTFFVNYISPQAGNGGGGTVELDGCADRVDISNNTFTGPSATTLTSAGAALPSGYAPFPITTSLELYSRNTNIANNVVTAYGQEGIGAFSLYDDPAVGAQINQNHILHDNGWDTTSPSGGISVGTSFAAGVCGTRPRETNTVTVTGNDSDPMVIPAPPVPPGPPTQAYGVHLEDHGEAFSTGRLFSIEVDGSNFSGQYPLYGQSSEVFLDPYVGLYSSSVPPLNTPSSPDPDPRLLPADVIGASSTSQSFTPLWPVPLLCSEQYNPPSLPPGSSRGSQRALFKFYTSDDRNTGSTQGAANIAQIQGIWSTEGADADGSGGPGGYYCNFVYYTATNTIYLWDNVNLDWISSIVGTWNGQTGIDLTASGCTLHTATSTSWVSQGSPAATPQAYVMDLTLGECQ